MPAPIGNKNASKGKWARSVIMERLAERAAMGVMIDALLDKAMDGDLQAIREVLDRVDGKPTQQVDLGGQEDNPIVTEIQVKLVKPNDPTG